MNIVDQLSSRMGDRTSNSNRVVAAKCLQERSLLESVAVELSATDKKLAADCAEVMTMVAQQSPELVAPYAVGLTSLLSHRHTRARWEAMHAIALIAHLVPKVVETILPDLARLIESDSSVIVRDYATDTVAAYAGTGKNAAGKAFPLLMLALERWGDRHAGHALEGLRGAARTNPSLRGEIVQVAGEYIDSTRGVVRKAAARLLKSLS